jgi:glycosyltransferase involved in cell wall biosynthesis
MTVNKNKRLEILISAHELSPELGSECSSGWNVITRLCNYHNITVLYAETNQFNTNNYRNQIKNFLSEKGLIKGLKFISVPQPKITNRIAFINKLFSNKKSSVGISFLYFLGVRFWEKQVLKKSKKIIKSEHIDIVHHFNHLSFREPGFLWKLNKPFVWGPTSGISSIPYSFLLNFPLKTIISNFFRNTVGQLQGSFSVRVNRAIQKASLIYFVTSEDELFFSNKTKNIQHLLDTGGYLSINSNVKLEHSNRINIIWVGRLDYLKSLNLLLEALESDEYLKLNVDITVIGDGPEADLYKNKAKELGLENINWVGQVSKQEVLTKMKEADFLVHTSVKEAASAVMLEALSHGLPVICHDAFGLAYGINDTCGIKIPFDSPKESVIGFKNVIKKLAKNRNLITHLSKGAVKRSQELSWDTMAKNIAKNYTSAYKNFT